MATKHHNYISPATLMWVSGEGGAPWVAQSWRAAKYHAKGTQYTVKYNFAFLRPAHDANGLISSRAGWVVSRGGFEDLAHYNTFDEAKLYVEALFALEMS